MPIIELPIEWTKTGITCDEYDAWTIDGWVYRPQTTEEDMLFGVAGNIACCYLRIADRLLMLIITNSSIIIIKSNTTTPADAWHYITVTRDSNAIKLYINGENDEGANISEYNYKL